MELRTYSTVDRRLPRYSIGERRTPASAVRDQGSDLFDGELQTLEQASKEESLGDVVGHGCKYAFDTSCVSTQ